MRLRCVADAEQKQSEAISTIVPTSGENLPLHIQSPCILSSPPPSPLPPTNSLSGTIVNRKYRTQTKMMPTLEESTFNKFYSHNLEQTSKRVIILGLLKYGTLKDWRV